MGFVMTFLRTAAAVMLLNLPVHAQPLPTASNATAAIDGADATVLATINNPTMYDVYLVSGKCASAAAVAFLDGDKAIESITVPAYGSVELKPGAQRVRLSGLKAQLKDGDELKLTLETDGGVSIEVTAIVTVTNPNR